MENYKDVKKGGAFKLLSGTDVQGELVLNGEATTLELYSEEFFDTHSSQDIFGTFYDRSKVSLIDCITLQGPGSGVRGNERYHFSTVFPHFAIFGDDHISSADRVISQLSFTVDDAENVFYDFEAFGSIDNARHHMEQIVGEREAGKNIEIGKHPHIFYFTGKYEILSVDTLLGQISVYHGLSYTSPGPSGIHVDNTIKIDIAFKSRKTLQESVASVLDLLRFIEIIAGRPQNVSELKIIPGSTEDCLKTLDVYWCLSPRRDSSSETRKPHPTDLPIQAATQPDNFASVLKLWLERNDEWRSARGRYSRAFAYQGRYDIDRLVGAANMFDILPSSIYAEAVPLTNDLEQAREAARKAFKALPVSPERDSVLGALGRIGKPSLKRKVRSRAKLISEAIPDQFQELEVVVDQAVDCRNYYVHGSVTKINFGEHMDQIHFLTDTLEFIFAASDLLQAGWDIGSWINQSSAISHPFGQYRINYSMQLNELKKLL